MKTLKKLFPLLLLLIVASLLLSGCSGRRFVPEGWPGISVEDDTAYVAYRDFVYFLDASGNEINHFPEEKINGQTFFAPPVNVGDGEMLVSSYAGNLYSFDMQTGKNRLATGDDPQPAAFAKRQSRFIDAPLLLDGMTYLSDTDRHLYALDGSHNEAWEVEFDQPLWSAPVTDGNLLYLTSIDNYLYALNPNTGDPVWDEPQDMGGTMMSAAAIDADGILYVGTFDSEVIAFNPNTRSALWTFSTEDWVWATPLVLEEVVYITDLGGNIYAVDRATGSQLWTYKVDGRITGSALVHEGQLYVGTEAGNLVALEADTGTLRWEREAPGEDAKAYSTPVAFGEQDIIMFGIVDADLIILAFDSNGTQLWSFAPEN